MGSSRFAEEVWVPVSIEGFGPDYEMCSLGFVRRVFRGPGPVRRLWLLPLDEGDGPLYRLRGAGGVAELAVRDIIGQSGACAQLGAAWLRKARSRALAENAVANGDGFGSEALRQAVCEGDDIDMEMLTLTIEHGCPWERARMGGDARGADPVLGF